MVNKPPYRLALAGTLVLVAVGALVLVVGSQQTLAATEPTCTQAEPYAPNATILDGSSLWADIVKSPQLNGSIGTVVFEGLPSDDVNYTVEEPDGDETSARQALNGETAFPGLTLCETGTWTVEDEAGDAVTKFNVTEDPNLVGSGTILVDATADTGPWEHEYDAGNMYADIGPTGADVDIDWNSDLTPTGYSAIEAESVHLTTDAFWDIDASTWSAVYLFCGDGEHTVSHCTSYAAYSGDSSREMELVVYWKAGEGYRVYQRVTAYHATDTEGKWVYTPERHEDDQAIVAPQI